MTTVNTGYWIGHLLPMILILMHLIFLLMEMRLHHTAYILIRRTILIYRVLIMNFQHALSQQLKRIIIV